jgi:hypothetical protein
MHTQTLSPKPCTKQEGKETAGKEREKKKRKREGKRKREKEEREKKERGGKEKGREGKKKRREERKKEERKEKKKEERERRGQQSACGKAPLRGCASGSTTELFRPRAQPLKATECDPGARQKKQVFHFPNFIFFCMAR